MIGGYLRLARVFIAGLAPIDSVAEPAAEARGVAARRQRNLLAARRREAQELADELWMLDRSTWDRYGVEGRRRVGAHWIYWRDLYRSGVEGPARW